MGLHVERQFFLQLMPSMESDRGAEEKPKGRVQDPVVGRAVGRCTCLHQSWHNPSPNTAPICIGFSGYQGHQMARVPSRSSLVSGKGHRLKRREARDTAAGSGNMVGLSEKWRRYLSLQQVGKTLHHFFYSLFRDMLIYRCTVIPLPGFDARPGW